MRKRKPVSITSPEELNKNLQYSSPLTWITLSAVLLLLAGFFVWSFLYPVQVKLTASASIVDQAVTLHVEESKLSQLKEGQKVYISGLEGQIVSLADKQPVVSSFALSDGDYVCYIVLRDAHPIDFFIAK